MRLVKAIRLSYAKGFCILYTPQCTGIDIYNLSVLVLKAVMGLCMILSSNVREVRQK